MKSNVVALPRARNTDRCQDGDEAAVPVVAECRPAEVTEGPPIELEVDGERVLVTADRELVLRCGKASITLTRAGKIILRGTHVVSRSSGVNRVQGTQVRIN